MLDEPDYDAILSLLPEDLFDTPEKTTRTKTGDAEPDRQRLKRIHPSATQTETDLFSY